MRNLRDYGRKERGGKRECEKSTGGKRKIERLGERETKREREIKRGGRETKREKRDFAMVLLHSFGLGSTWWLRPIQIWVSSENPIILLFSLSCVILVDNNNKIKTCQQDDVLFNYQN